MVRKTDNVEPQPGPPRQNYQDTGDHRYNKLNYKVKSESAHTITLENGVDVTKSAVAASKNASSKKRVSAGLPQPPRPRNLKQRKQTIKKEPMTKSLEKTGRKFEPVSASESEEECENLCLSITRTIFIIEYI